MRVYTDEEFMFLLLCISILECIPGTNCTIHWGQIHIFCLFRHKCRPLAAFWMLEWMMSFIHTHPITNVFPFVFWSSTSEVLFCVLSYLKSLQVDGLPSDLAVATAPIGCSIWHTFSLSAPGWCTLQPLQLGMPNSYVLYWLAAAIF